MGYYRCWVASGLTGLTSSGTITFSGLTADRLVTTTTGGALTTSISSANAALSFSDETGSGLVVFGTSPTISTSLVAGTSSFDLLNTTATTINFGGAASTLNIGPGSTTATSVNLAGGSGATGCTVDGATGNMACSGTITGAGTVGFWQNANGALSPATPYTNNSDLLIGSNASDSAKFAILNVYPGTAGSPTASVSTGLSGTSMFMTASGTLSTTNRGALTIGNSSSYNFTGDVLLNPNGTGNVGIGTTATVSKFQVAGGDILVDNGEAYQAKAPNGTARDMLWIGTGTNGQTRLRMYRNANTLSYADWYWDTVNSRYIIADTLGGSVYGGILMSPTLGTTLTVTEASSGTTTKDNTLTIQGQYWNGSATVSRDATIVHNITSTAPASQLDFSIAGSTYLTLLDTGNFGVGTTTPSNELEINGDVELTNLYDNDSSNFFDGGCSATTTVTGIDSTGAITCTTITGVTASSVAFSGITSGTNTTAAMVVGAGATLDYTSTGTINASSLIGGTWAIPGTIGSTTPNSGAFTTLSSTGITTLGNNSATVAINSSDWDISTAGAMTGISGITNDDALTSTGGIVSLNASSNFAVNIGTGTTTSTVSIGGNANQVAIDSSTWDISGAGVASGLTGLTSSGTITFSGLTADRLVTTTTGGALTNTISSANAALSFSDETGSGLIVYNTSPEINTSITTGSSNFDLLNATATTINFAGAASTLNIGPGSTTATSVNLAGGNAATGCTVDGATGNLTCSGTITGTGAIGYWTRIAGNLSPSTVNDTLSATSSASTVATFTTNNPAGTLTDNTLINQTGAGTVTNLLNLTQTAGTVSNGLTFTGTFGNLISATNFSVTNAGAVTAVGVNSGSGLLQGTGGLTLTGTTSINGSGTANTTIGNTAGGTITVGAASGSNLVLNDADWSVTGAGTFSGPVFQGNSGAVTFGNVAQATTITGSGLTVVPTGWTATPTISGLITATSGLTANGALTANSTFTLGDNGDTGSVDTSDWDISTTGAMTGISGITNDAALTSTGGIVSLNASSNFAVNIGTGTTTSTVSIGGNANQVAIDSSTWDITGAGVASGLTGLTSSGTITFSGLTADRLVTTTTGGALTTSISSANAALSFSDETGSGLVVFGTSPTLSTSLVTDTTSFDLLNTVATGTINFAGVAGTINIGPGGATATSINLAGGNGATGCTVDGATGDLNCSGAINGTGNIGYWNYINGAISPATPYTNNSDLLIGSNASASAKFAVLNVYPGTAGSPTASVSSGLSGTSMFMTADGSLSTQNRMSLYIGNRSGNDTTGNVLINSNGTGNVGIGNTGPTALFTIGSSSQFQVNSGGEIAAIDGVAHTLTDNAGNLSINSNGTKTEIVDDLQITGNDILDSAAGTRITLGATTTLTNTTTTLSGTSTLTASSLATFTTAATLGMSSTTTLNLGSNATINGGTAANDDLTLQGTSNATRATSYVLLQPTAGNVGIGTTAPAVKLQVVGSDLVAIFQGDEVYSGMTTGQLQIRGNTDPLLRLSMGYDTTSNFGWIEAGQQGIGYHNLALAPSGGNVGIGTTTIGAKLHVSGSSELLRLDDTSATGNPYLTLNQAGTRRSFIQHGDTNDVLNLVSEYGAMAFYAASSAGTDSDTQYMRLIAGGNVGIGTSFSSPTAHLHIYGAGGDGTQQIKVESDNGGASAMVTTENNDASNTLSMRSYGSGFGGSLYNFTVLSLNTLIANNNLAVGTSAAADFAFITSNTRQMTLTSGGNLGIGTTTIRAELDVEGSASSSGTLSFRGTTDPKIDILNNENFGIRTSVGGNAGLTERLTILGNGNVGIGTTGPSSPLHVQLTNTTYNAASTILRLSKRGTVSASNTDGAGARIEFASSDIDGNNITVAAIDGVLIDPNYNGGGRRGDLVFSTIPGDIGAMTERMRIDNAGNVGIGTTDPDAQLQIHSTSASTNRRMAFTDATTGATATDGFVVGKATDESAYLYNYENSYLYLGTNNAERLRIEAGGDIGINTTNPETALHIRQSTALGGTAGNYQLGETLEFTSGGNRVYERTWAYRDSSSSSDWLTTRIHNGLSVDASFGTPNTDDKTWWERDLNNNLQSWGTGASTYMTLSGAALGIGTVSPGSTVDAASAAITAGYWLDGKAAMTGETADNWLRLNQSQSWTNGVYTPANLRVDGALTLDGVFEVEYSGTTHILNVTSGHATASSIKLLDSTPNTMGSVYGDTDGTNFGLLDADGNWALRSVKDTSIDFLVNNSQKMTILTGGNIGIGTTTPSALLDIAGTASSSGTLSFRGTTDPKINVLNGEAFGIRTSVGGDAGLAEALTITTPGNVGIGTTAPTRLFQIEGASNPAVSIKTSATERGTFSVATATDAWFTGTAANDTALRSAANLWVGTLNANNINFSTNNVQRMTILSGGNIGIGTTTTRALLDIAGTASASGSLTFTGAGAQIKQLNGQAFYISASTGGDGGLAAKFSVLTNGFVGINQASPSQTLDVNGEIQFDIATTGDTTIGVCKNTTDGTGTNTEFRECNGAAGDIAEFYKGTDGLQPGDLVSITTTNNTPTVVKTSKANDPNILGVVSTYPVGQFGKPLSNETVLPQDNPTAIGLSGKVPVKVTLENGPIKVGDPLVSASKPGYAMKATKAGKIIGYALEAFDGSTQVTSEVRKQEKLRAQNIVKYNKDPIDPPAPEGKILFFISASYYDPNITFTSEGELAISGSNENYTVTAVNGSQVNPLIAGSKALIGKLTAGFIASRELVVTQSATITSLSVNSLQVSGQTISDYIRNIIQQELQTTPLPPGAVAEEFTTDILQVNQDATISGTLAAETISTENLSATTSALGSLLAETATISGDLNVEQDASVAGTLIAGNIESESSRFSTLEARMAELEHIKAQTADLVDATISGTLYADSIYNFDEKVAESFKKPTLLDLLTQPNANPVEAASPASIYEPVEAAGYQSVNPDLIATDSAILSLNESDVVLGASALFVEKYLEVNGFAYVSQTLGVGDTLKVGNSLTITNGTIDYHPEGVETPVLALQSSGKGKLELLAGVMTIEAGHVRVTGSMTVAGALKADTLLTNLAQPADFGTPFQVQVAGVSTESGELKKTRFEIINETGQAVASFDADGNASFQGGVSVGNQNLTSEDSSDDTVNTDKSSGKAKLTSGKAQLKILTPKATPDSLIYVTPKGSTENKVLYIKGQGEGEFTVGFDSAIGTDVEFNWWIVN